MSIYTDSPGTKENLFLFYDCSSGEHIMMVEINSLSVLLAEYFFFYKTC